jgi:tetratricopeptide (TPR) repeat protein/transcriptional regulator with XRE-family HTH domain
MLGMAAESTVRFPEKPNGRPRRERLVMRRKALGLTQEHLAALLHVERTTVARWERGETEPLPWLRPKLAKAIRVTSDQLAELLDGGGSSGSGGTASVPRQLPAAVADFTGRAAELATLTKILDTAADRGTTGTVVISAIGGTAGVGKTALALHWAHNVATRFPDGQLHVNLRGFDPTGPAATPEEAIRGFLLALGVPIARISPDPDAQTGLYRSLLADRRMLIVLDNARDERQVRPLLPASPASLVIITSRNSLAGLAASDGARLIGLDVLTHDEAVKLLFARLGADRATAQLAACAEIATLCACLPLALAIAAARAVARPRLPLSALAAELRAADGRLDALDTGDPAASVRAVFSWSCEQLSRDGARMFRLLGLHPGPDISVPAAASLAATDQPATRRMLGELARAQLISEHLPGRFAFHDLLRAYAAEQAREHDDKAERDAAVGRFLDHYLHTADRAWSLLRPWRESVALAPPRRGVISEPLSDARQAMDWFEAEQEVLLAAVALADRTPFDAYAWQLPVTAHQFLVRRGDFRRLLGLMRTAFDAATRLGDISGQAASSLVIGQAYVVLGDLEQARTSMADSLARYQRLSSQPGEARAHHALADLAERQGRWTDALDHAANALRLYRAAGLRLREAEMLNHIGETHAALGDFEQGRALCRQALAISTQHDHEAPLYAGTGSILDTLGHIERRLGNVSEAVACYERALGIFRKIGFRSLVAASLVRLGEIWRDSGEPGRAEQAWREALVIYQDLGLPGAEEIRAKLASNAADPA